MGGVLWKSRRRRRKLGLSRRRSCLLISRRIDKKEAAKILSLLKKNPPLDDVDLQGSCILLKMKLNCRSDWRRTKMKFRFRCLDFAVLESSKSYN